MLVSGVLDSSDRDQGEAQNADGHFVDKAKTALAAEGADEDERHHADGENRLGKKMMRELNEEGHRQRSVIGQRPRA